MKNLMLLFILIIITLLSTANAAKITDPVLNVGENATSDFTILHKDGGYLKKVGTQGDWFFSADGALEKKMGSGEGGSTGGIQFLANASFEDAGTPILNWTNSGGTLTQETHTNGREANLSFARFVSTVAAEYVESDAITISDDAGSGCMADFKYMQGDTAFDYKVLKSPYADPADVISEGSISDLTLFLKAPTIVFDCAGGDLLKLRIVSTGAGTIDVDEAYLGSNKGFVPFQGVAQEYLATAGLRVVDFWNSTSPGEDEFDESLIVGLSTSKLLKVVNASGEDRITAIDRVNISVTAGLGNAGTNGGPEVLNSSGEKLAMTQASANDSNEVSKSASLILEKDDYILIKGINFDTREGGVLITAIAVSETQEAFTPEQADFFIAAGIGGANIPITTSPTDVEIQVNGLDMVLQKGDAKIACAGAPSTGLTCAGNESVGIAFNAHVSGFYKTCFSYSSDIYASFRINHTQNNSASIISLGSNGKYIDSLGGFAFNRLCEYFNISVGENTFRLMNTTSGTAQIVADRASAQSGRDITVTVELVSHNVSRPIIQNMVTTGAGSGVKIGTCMILNNTGVASFDSSDPDCWFVNSVTWISTGIVEIASTDSGFKCNAGSYTDARYTSFVNTSNGRIDGPLPQTFRTVTRNDAGTMSDDTHALFCSLNR